MIANCLQAIVSQKGLDDYEVVVVDDGSTDTTGQIIQDFAAVDSHVKPHPMGTNQGRGAARAAGVTAARGDYIALVDGDTILPAHWLEACLSKMDAYDAVGGVAVPDGDVSYIYSRFNLTPKVTKHATTVSGSNGLYKRAVFDAISFQSNLREGEDVAFNHLMDNSRFQTHGIHDLVVLHREQKSFRDSLRWLYQSGVGAARQLKQFGKIRLPDLTFFGFLFVMAASISLTIVWPLALLVPLLYVLAVSTLHVYTKFKLRPAHVLKFTGAILVNAMLVLYYFAGRSVGMVAAKPARAPKKVAVCFDYEGQWGMPFDAAYDLAGTTHRLLDIMDTYHVKATFFTVGKLVQTHPEIVQELVRRGHIVELHGYEHDRIIEYSPQQLQDFAANVQASTAQIQELTGRKPAGFRAPFLMSPVFYDPAVYKIFEQNSYTWTSNRELRYAEELFRPDRLGLRFLWGRNGFVMRWLGVVLNAKWLATDNVTGRGWPANVRWFLAGAAPFARGNLREVPVYSPLDCDLVGTPDPSAKSSDAIIKYATDCLVGGINRPGNLYSINFHDWIIGTSNRIEIFERTLQALTQTPDITFCSSQELAGTINAEV